MGAASLFHRGQALPTSWPADQDTSSGGDASGSVTVMVIMSVLLPRDGPLSFIITLRDTGTQYFESMGHVNRRLNSR